jgi:tryptophan synthase alpha chain
MTLEGIFNNGKNGGRAALIGYLPAGFPDPEVFQSVLSSLVTAGLQCVEIGIPTKNPVLDGQIISSALTRMEERGLTFPRAMSLSGDALRLSKVAGICMIYRATLMEIGAENVLSDLRRQNFQGVLVPDLPLDEWRPFAGLASDYAVKPIGFLSARMGNDEVGEVASYAEGFLYFQSYEGQTGNHLRIDSEIMDRLKRVKQIVGKRRLPVAVGFGIHSPEDARKLQQGGADGVIIGTALVEAVAESSKRAERFILEIARALAGDC